MIKNIHYIVIFLFIFQAYSQELDETIPKDKMVKELYHILSIDSTERYYLYKAVTKRKDNVLLVVDKKSTQLKGKKIKTDSSYTFKAYRYYDIFSFNAILCHYIDNQEIWCHTDNIDLRFTDGMGDEYYEED